MRTLVLFFFILIFLGNADFVKAETGINFGLFYPVPQNSTLRNEYYIDIPYASPEFGMSFKLNDFINLGFDISYRSISTDLTVTSKLPYELEMRGNPKIEEVIGNQGSGFTADKLSLNIIPITISAMHFFNQGSAFVPFVGLGIEDYSVFYQKELPKSFEDGRLEGKYTKMFYHNGLGFAAEAGLNMRVGNNKYLGLSLKYDYTFMGAAKDGGLENIGGVYLKLKYYSFWGGKK